MDMGTIKGIIVDLDDTTIYSFKHPDLEGQPLPGIPNLLIDLSARYQIAGATNQAGPLYQKFQPQIIEVKNAFSQTWKPKDYPTAEQIAEKLARSWEALGLAERAALHVSVYDEQVMRLLMPSQEQAWADAQENFLPGKYADRGKVLHAAEQIAVEMRKHFLEREIAAYVYSTPEYRKPEPGMLVNIARQWGFPCDQIVYVGDMYTSPRDSDLVAARAAGMQFLAAEEIQQLLD